MNNSLRKTLDEMTGKRLDELKTAITGGCAPCIERAARRVAIIGTETATGSLVHLTLTMHVKETTRRVMALAIANCSPARERYRQQLLTEITSLQSLALLHKAFEKECVQPVWTSLRETFDAENERDQMQLHQLLS